MFSKDQASQLKQEFWTKFGQYLSLQTSAEGTKINWINYKTGIKHLYFKMESDRKSASIAIQMNHPDPSIQQLLFEQFLEFKSILRQQYLQEDWEWELHYTDEYGKTASRIITRINNVNIFKQEDWPAIISFLKPRIIALDEFWSDAQYNFDLFK